MRRRGFGVFVAPHRRWQPGDYERWSFPTANQLGAAMHAAHALNGPTYAHAILTTAGLLSALEAAA